MVSSIQFLRWFEVHGLSTVFSPVHLLGPAAIFASTEDLIDPHCIHSSSPIHHSDKC